MQPMQYSLRPALQVYVLQLLCSCTAAAFTSVMQVQARAAHILTVFGMRLLPPPTVPCRRRVGFVVCAAGAGDKQ
jgi:hypothetical protein